MPVSPQVHWHEGLFLQPHHVQMLQRQVYDLAADGRGLAVHHPWGVLDMRLSDDALEGFAVRFDRLRAVMPGGTVVDFPDDAELPALNIEQAYHADPEPLVVCLAVPVYHPARANAVADGSHAAGSKYGSAGNGRAGGGDGWRSNQLFRVAEVSRADENTGQNRQDVQVRRLNARLILDGDDRTDLEVLPLLRVVHAASDEGVGLPRRDADFVAPSLLLKSAPRLYEMARDLSALLETRRRELLEVIRRSGATPETMQPHQFGQLMRLRIYHGFAARLPSILAAPATTPFDVYLELRGMLGELTALHPDKGAALFDTAAYDHESPFRPFDELTKKLRNLLTASKKPAEHVVFEKDGGYLVARLKEEHLTQPSDYYVCIHAPKQDAAALTRLVEDGDRFKLMPPSEIRKSLYGVKLQAERFPPMQLPSRPGLHYFRVDRGESGRMWELVRQQRAMALKWPDMSTSEFFVADKSVVLMMPVPDAGE